MKPLLVFDGDCGFCRVWIRRFQERTGDRVDYAPSQEVGDRFPEIPARDFARSVQLIDVDGKVYAGAEAVFRTLAAAPGGGAWLRAYGSVPGFAPVTEWAYHLVAGHRVLFSRLTRWLWGRHAERPTYAIAGCLFPRALAVIYLMAFVSLGVQVIGLAGHDGILPAQPFLDAVAGRYGAERFWLLPTLGWISASDGFLRFLCWGGALVSAAAAAGIATGPCLLIAWAFYLSLSVVVRTFLNFQWDILLLEAGFLAIFLAPWRLRCRIPCPREGPRPIRWLVLWLLCRLMFSSGVVKLTSGDPTWWNLTALDFHYWTQPIPTWSAWIAGQAPEWFLRLSCAFMFAVELLAPFLLFLPRRPRLLGCGLLVALQVLIAATGNYAYFNWLSMALCLVAIDDLSWPSRWFPRRPIAPPRRWPVLVAAPFVALIVLASTVEMLAGMRVPIDWPRPVALLIDAISPFRIANSYGLFRVMTKTREEIVVEGSNDGTTWQAYEFKWKPGDPARRPGFVAPHQPRLDWQMWFAALNTYRNAPWFQAFLARLLQGSPDVLALLERNPFPDGPPRYIRSSLYDYRFTDLATLRTDGTWWRREYRGPYGPPMSRPGP
jgi:predicted DCC family thiol-disulfide oxidoreductase YuxK